MNSRGYTKTSFDPQPTITERSGKIETRISHLERKHLIIRNDQGASMLDLPILNGVLLGLTFFPLAALVAAAVLEGLLYLELK